jgi:hypothetical protein
MPWLAEHLHLRSAVNASQQIRRHRRQPRALARKLQKWMVQSINAADPLFFTLPDHFLRAFGAFQAGEGKKTKPQHVDFYCVLTTAYCSRGRMKRSTEAFRSPELLEIGCGYVVICRFKADGRCEAGFFLLDIFCLGVKDGAFESFSDFRDFEKNLLNPIFRGEEPVRMMPAAGRKLIEDAVAYARDLGFAPAADYKKASRVLGGITTMECEEEFVFGKDGKPFYIQGPSESPERCAWILQTLERRCGEGSYEYLLAAGMEDNDSFDEEAEIGGSDAGRIQEGPGYDAKALQEMARRYQAERPEARVCINPAGRPKLSDRLALVAEPLLEMAADHEEKRTIVNFAALAWNFAMIDPARSEQMLKDVLRILPDADGAEMFLFLAARVRTLFPEEDRIIVKVETDPAPHGSIFIRVMSSMPDDQVDAEPMEIESKRRQPAFAAM